WMQGIDPRAAVRCYWESLRLEPHHPQANYQLGQALIALDQSDRAAPFLQRSRELEKFYNAVKLATTDGDMRDLRAATELAESLELYWEAFAWAQLSVRRSPDAGWARQAV